MPSVTLSSSLHSVAEQLADAAGFRSAEAYIEELVRRDLEQRQQRDPDLFLREAMTENGDPSAVTPERLAARKGEIEVLLVEGLNSGDAVEIDDAFWQERRRVLQERIAARKQSENP
jgi:Arc/MetJ-type ribon-helix-helix transcriptional regulator